MITVVCDKCDGLKRLMGVGCMFVDCPKCDAKGFMKVHTDLDKKQEIKKQLSEINDEVAQATTIDKKIDRRSKVYKEAFTNFLSIMKSNGQKMDKEEARKIFEEEYTKH